MIELDTKAKKLDKETQEDWLLVANKAFKMYNSEEVAKTIAWTVINREKEVEKSKRAKGGNAIRVTTSLVEEGGGSPKDPPVVPEG